MIWPCPVNKETLLTENVSKQIDPPLLVPLYDVQYNTVHLLTYVTGPAKIDHVSAKKSPIFSVFAVS